MRAIVLSRQIESRAREERVVHKLGLPLETDPPTRVGEDNGAERKKRVDGIMERG
jgi:hypothetical protein